MAFHKCLIVNRVSYLALARKFRPRDFTQVVGQEHVVNALKHALDTNRVHHAFLLTGTRGIGKTTIARILAKSLNCQTNGVSSAPCNQCDHCIAVDEGRFIDLIEVDAASRTKVDDTRDLLDNVQYAPTVGEYKIYLIDEVHMLSGHSFNALLKTLEEPPPHIKFVLATTDPQKLPVTVLSRCLQFYLKALTNEQISAQLKTILDLEAIKFEDSAIRLLARSARGSMRDALSLLDQTIAFGGGEVEETKVRSMLGLVDDQFIFQLLDGLANNDVNHLLKVCDEMGSKSVDFVNTIEELSAKFHQISVLHFSPDIEVETIVDKTRLTPYTQVFDKETLQLFYQMALMAKRDIYLAPDLRTGMEMALLRMLAFTPDTESNSTGTTTRAVPKTDSTAALKRPVKHQDSDQSVNPEQHDRSQEPALSHSDQKKEPGKGELNVAMWPQFVEGLNLTGFAREVVMNAVLSSYENNLVVLTVDDSCSHFVNDKRKQMIESAFAEKFNESIKVKLNVGQPDQKTPHQLDREQQDKNLEQAEHSIMNDPNIKELIDTLDASIVPGSIKAT